MPDSAEHRAEMHHLAQARRDAGKRTWDRKINLAGVFGNDTMTFPERRDEIARRLRASRWYTTQGEDSTLAMFIEELTDAQTTEAFNSAWDAIYDEADADRIWISTS